MVGFCRFLLLSVAVCPSAHANPGTLMRRQDELQLSEVKIHEHRSIDIHGDGVLAQARGAKPLSTLSAKRKNEEVHKSSEELAKEALEKDIGQDGADAITTCDRDFHVMDEGTDECSVGDTIYSREDCFLASKQLGANMSANYMLNTHQMNPLPYPKGCLVNMSNSPNTLDFNPSATATTGMTLLGKKICMRRLYVNGTENTDADAACTGAGAGYVTILEYDACQTAMTCHKGGGAPKLLAFEQNDTTYMPTDKPIGCFTEVSTGKWGFNWAHKNSITVDPTSFSDVASICYDSTADTTLPSSSTGGF